MTKEEEYKKDINEIKKEILREGDTLVTKRALLERFCKITEEYESLNLLQILANISILVGQEPSIKKKGKWIRVDHNKVKCSKCEITHLIAQYPHGAIDFCPNCGAEMESEE